MNHTGEHSAQILHAQRDADTSTVRLRVSFAPGVAVNPPLMPAGLYDTADPAREIFQLHKLVAEIGDTLTYETYNQNAPLPLAGCRHIFRFWWFAWQLEAVLDTQTFWVRRCYPENGDHEHCLLTWKTISARDEHSEGYYSEAHGWITVEAYETYILKDLLRIRLPGTSTQR